MYNARTIADLNQVNHFKYAYTWLKAHIQLYLSKMQKVDFGKVSVVIILLFENINAL